jgi:hypothetical protein
MKAVTVRGLAVLGFLGVACTGCVVDVELQSTPRVVNIGAPVEHEVTVTNRSVCPVGGVTSLLFPLVPRNILIDQIQDPDLREFLSQLVDAFCSGQLVEPPDGVSGNCELVDGDLMCTFNRDSQGGAPGTPQESVALFTTESGEEVTCGNAGSTITCRIPKAIMQMGDTALASTPQSSTLPCLGIDGVVVCFTLTLDPSESKTGTAKVVAEKAGVYRNWAVTMAERKEGVCTGGIFKGVPCNDDGDCFGLNNDCGSGICVGGTRDGFGCNVIGDCPSGTECRQCGLVDDQFVPGIACTTTVVGAEVPTMSTWPLAALALALTGAAGIQLRRMRRRRRVL